MNTVAKGFVTVAAVGLGGIAMGFQGLGWMFSQGHKVANGVRTVADGIDAVSTFGETQCDAATEACLALADEYEQIAQEYEDEVIQDEIDKAEAAEKVEDTGRVRPVVGIVETEGVMA